MRFTIVTTTFNEGDTISTSLSSILEQTYSNWEYWVIDGGSTDNTVSILKEFCKKDRRIKYISEPDKGIYNAMNKSLALSSGEYIYFLGSGDVLSSKGVLEKVDKFIKKKGKNPDIIYGWVYLQSNLKIKYKHKINIMYTLRFRPVSHQAIFANRKLLSEKKFDESYKIVADQEWIMYQYSKKKYFSFLNIPIAIFDTNGVSSSKNGELIANIEMSKILATYFPGRLKIYHFIKKNSRLFRKLRR